MQTAVFIGHILKAVALIFSVAELLPEDRLKSLEDRISTGLQRLPLKKLVIFSVILIAFVYLTYYLPLLMVIVAGSLVKMGQRLALLGGKQSGDPEDLKSGCVMVLPLYVLFTITPWAIGRWLGVEFAAKQIAPLLEFSLGGIRPVGFWIQDPLAFVQHFHARCHWMDYLVPPFVISSWRIASHFYLGMLVLVTWLTYLAALAGVVLAVVAACGWVIRAVLRKIVAFRTRFHLTGKHLFPFIGFGLLLAGEAIHVVVGIWEYLSD